MLVSGQYFQEQCRWNFDNRYPTRVWVAGIDVRKGDRVFMKASDIPAFVMKCRFLLVKVIAVVHNTDESFTDDIYRLISPYVEGVYAVNNVSQFAHSLPLGFRDHQYVSHHVLKKLSSDPEIPRTTKCLVNFLISTNPQVRQHVYDLFKDKPWCKAQDYVTYDFVKSLMHHDSETMTKRADFYTTLKSTRFALCPQGTGIDTHRVYECILFGVIPIVMTSPLDVVYKQLPVLIVSSWNDVTEDLLDNCTIQPNPSAIIHFNAMRI